MGCEEVIERSQQSYEALCDFKDGVNKWKSYQWHEKRREGDKLVKTYQEAFQLMLDYRTTMGMVFEEMKESKGADQRRRRNYRTKIGKEMQQSVPPLIRQKVSAIIEANGQDRFQQYRTEDTCEFENEDHFAKPCSMFHSDPPSTEWHKYAQEIYRRIQLEAESRAEKGVSVLKKRGRSHAATMLQPRAECSSSGQEVGLPSEYFKLAADSRMAPVMFIQESFQFSAKDWDILLAGCPMLMQVMKGYALYVFVYIQDLIEAGRGVETITEYISEQILN